MRLSHETLIDATTVIDRKEQSLMMSCVKSLIGLQLLQELNSYLHHICNNTQLSCHSYTLIQIHPMVVAGGTSLSLYPRMC
jgi:hypothetical protein